MGSEHDSGPNRFEIAFRARAVEVIVPPDAERPSVDAIESALRRSPLARIDREAIEAALGTPSPPGLEVRIAVGDIVAPQGASGPCAVIVSPDGLAAYAIPVPASAVAEDIDAATSTQVSAESLRQLLSEADVTSGLLDDAIEGFGTGIELELPRCVARGREPVPASDATLEFRFDPKHRLLPKVRDDGSVDHHTVQSEQFVGEATVLAVRHAPVAGSDGEDVRGRRLPVEPPKDIVLERMGGKNTAVRGEEIVSLIAGRPVLTRDGKIEVVPVFEVPQDLDYSVGNIDFSGDVVIRGDVRPGFSIAAGGSVLVRGLVEGGRIKAGRDLSVMGAAGEHGSVFEVGGDLVARYLHSTRATVGGSANIGLELVNCTLTARTVRTGPQGRIIGGSVTAQDEVDTGTLGSHTGTRTEVIVTSRESSAVIRARRAAFPGVALQLGRTHRGIEDELAAVSFWDVSGTIISLKAAVDESEVRDIREGKAQEPEPATGDEEAAA